MMARVRTETR